MSLRRYLPICLSLFVVSDTAGVLPRKVYKKDGDLVIGGLVPLHNFDESTERCSQRRDIGSLRLVEALVFALSTVNKTRLGELTLGYEIYDTCSSSSETLWNSLAYIPPARIKDNILGIVGPQRSSSSIQATKLLGLYDIPVVSYLSTSDELSNSGKYPYFLRTVPPDKYQVNVIVDILTKYNWTYVAFIYSDDTYGHNALAEFLVQTEYSNICVGYSSKIPMTATGDAPYNQTLTRLRKLRSGTMISVVVLFIQLEMARNLFQHAHEQGVYREFIWIGSDGWGNYGLDPVIGVEDTALGAFTIVPKSADLPNFDDYFRDVSLSDNPWLGEFADEIEADWLHAVHSSSGERPHYESMVSDAVGVYVQALSNMRDLTCVRSDSTADCADKIISRRDQFKEFLMDVSFHSPSNGLLQFTANGDAVGRYDIWQLQVTDDGQYRFSIIGSWSDDGVSIDQPKFYLETTDDRQRNTEKGDIPMSICNDPCGPLETIIPDGCCWSCLACAAGEILVDNMCVSCYVPTNGTYTWPDGSGKACKELPHIKTGDKPECIAVITISCMCLILELVIVIFYVKNKDAKLIRASSRELCYIILVGVFLTLIASVVYAMSSTIYTCIALRIVPYVALSLIYVPIATMTIRLHRIFQAGKRSTKRPKFISPVSQVILSLALTMVPIVWSSIWIKLEHPVVVRRKENDDRGPYIDASCSASYPELFGHLIWHFLIVSICCYFAVQTRKLPSNYNQSRFIAFTAFCTLVVFLAFTPAYFFSSDARARDLYSSLGAILQSVVVLILLFVVKLYAVYFVNEEKQVVVSTTRAQRTEDEELTSQNKTTPVVPTNGSQAKN